MGKNRWATTGSDTRCPKEFVLRTKDRGPGRFSQCLLAEGHRGSHKSVKPGGVVLWKEREKK